MTDHDGNLRPIWSEAELDAALDDLQADVPTDERALSEARAGLLAAAGQPGEGNPMGTTTEMPDVRPAPAGRQPYRGRWLAAAAAVVALTAGGVLVAQNLGSDQDFRGPVTGKIETASQVLKRAAAQIDVSGDERVAEGQYRYRRNHGWGLIVESNPTKSGKEFAYLSETIEEQWIPADETQKWLTRTDVTGEQKWLVGTAEEAAADGIDPDESIQGGEGKAPCGGNERGSNGNCAGDWPGPTPSWAASLPTDPSKMLEVLRAKADESGDPIWGGRDAQAVMIAAQSLERGVFPADVRAALYRAFAKMPEVEITEKLANLDGRTGTAFGIPGSGKVRIDIIVDSGTGEYIGTRTVQVKPVSGIEPGTVVHLSSSTTAVVDDMGQRPPK